MNPVVISVCTMLILSLLRMNVVIALTSSAIIGGLISGMDIKTTIKTFEEGLGNGATIALSYGMLGAFAVAVSRSGIADFVANKVIHTVHNKDSLVETKHLKFSLMFGLILVTMSSQNIIPIHIAFIPILIPPLLNVFNKLKIDRRMVACIMTFGLITPYLILPIGFGGVFLHTILLKNLANNGLEANPEQITKAMALPVLGMIIGLLISIFFSYRKPREYKIEATTESITEAPKLDLRHTIVASAGIIIALCVQLITSSMIVGAMSGFIIFVFGGLIRWKETQDVFVKGVEMMAMVGFIMIAAAGFAAVMDATGGVETLVESLSSGIGENRSLAAFLMLLVGLLITMGIGSSFSTIPVIATIYVPLAAAFGFSPLATIALVGTAAALGDAGSPASDSTLGPTAGLNMDGQHDHIWGTVVPTFIHYNIPLLIFGWIAAMVL